MIKSESAIDNAVEFHGEKFVLVSHLVCALITEASKKGLLSVILPVEEKLSKEIYTIVNYRYTKMGFRFEPSHDGKRFLISWG